MRKVKWLITGFVVLICIFFMLALLLPSKVTVSRSIEINASQTDVQVQLDNFYNWKNWYPAFSERDISAILSVNQNDSLHRFMQLKDRRQHNIIFRLMQSSADTVKIDLQTNDQKSTDYVFVLLPGREQTLSIWNVNVCLGWYPWQRLKGLVMDKITGPAYLSGLENLKKVIESNANYPLKK